jgi:hypothetical protein
MTRRRIDRYLYSEGYALVRCNNHRVYRNGLGQTIVVSNTPRAASCLFTYVRANVRRNERVL